MLGVVMREQPPGAARIGVCPLAPFFMIVGHVVVGVEIGKIGDNMEVAPAGRISDNQAGWVELFEPQVGFRQPGTLGGVGQVDAPAFIHDRPDADAWVISITLQHTGQGFAGTAFRILGQ